MTNLFAKLTATDQLTSRDYQDARAEHRRAIHNAKMAVDRAFHHAEICRIDAYLDPRQSDHLAERQGLAVMQLAAAVTAYVTVPPYTMTDLKERQRTLRPWRKASRGHPEAVAFWRSMEAAWLDQLNRHRSTVQVAA